MRYALQTCKEWLTGSVGFTKILSKKLLVIARLHISSMILVEVGQRIVYVHFSLFKETVSSASHESYPLDYKSVVTDKLT